MHILKFGFEGNREKEVFVFLGLRNRNLFWYYDFLSKCENIYLGK